MSSSPLFPENPISFRILGPRPPYSPCRCPLMSSVQAQAPRVWTEMLNNVLSLPLQIHADSGAPCNPRHLSHSGRIDRRSIDSLPWDTLTRCFPPSVRNCVILRRSFSSTTRNRGSKGSRPFFPTLPHLEPRRNPIRAGMRLHRPDRPNHGQHFIAAP
jgi:hypothetical protein